MTETPNVTGPGAYPKKVVILRCVRANSLFLVASLIVFFASTVKKSRTPYDDDSPYYGLLYFSSFITVGP